MGRNYVLLHVNIRSSINGSLCLFGVVSLFTNVPLIETIDICCDALYHTFDVFPPTSSEQSFREDVNN